MVCRALIVDDETILVSNLATALTGKGLQATSACSAAEARARLHDTPYDLLCIDINLGDGNGLELIEFARTKRPDLPVIVMTGRDTVSNRLRAEGLEANAFLAKPFALGHFRELARCLIGRDRLEDSSTSGKRASRAPRILMYSHDSIGLGHVRRNGNIACALVEKNADASVLMMVGSPAGVGFDLPPGVDFVKLPSVVKTARDSFMPGKLRISQPQAKALRESLILQAAQAFRPDVFLADHVASGVWGELLPTLRYLKSCPCPPRVVLGLRDVLDAPSEVAKSWERNGTRAAIETYYDDILVYGEQAVFDTVGQYGLDQMVAGGARYCGYAIAPEARAMRREPPSTHRATIVVTAGGGLDAYPMMQQVMAALAVYPDDARPDATFIAGALMPEELRTSLTAAAADIGAEVLKSTPSALAYIARADLVVTMGGYNTMVEAAHLGTPAIVIPRLGPSAEQRTRAERFDRIGLVRCLEPQDASPDRLFAEMERALRTPVPPSHKLDTEGATRAAAFLAARAQLTNTEEPSETIEVRSAL